MDTKRRLVTTALVIALCAGGGSTAARAEVSAEVDAFGNYVRTVVISNASVKNPKIWSSHHASPHRVPLNTAGDANGDLFPVIAENPQQFNHPWVVWSWFHEQEYDLAWSRWTAAGWDPVRPVAPAATVGDDLDPALALDASGRPHLVWWSNELGVGRVYLSVYLATQWMDPLPVSDAGVDSRYPSVELQDGLVVVRYETPQGPGVKVLTFTTPDSINDDINPFESFAPAGEPEESVGDK